MTTYILDIKVYEPASIMEVPFYPHSKMEKDGVLVPGYHSVRMTCTEDQFDEFMEWERRNQNILKVIGSEKV